MNLKQIWWEKVPNVAHFLQEIQDALSQDESLLVFLPQEAPWRDFALELIKRHIDHLPNRSLKELRAEAPVEETMLRHFCKEEKRVLYRKTKSIAQFLAEDDSLVLNQAIVFVDGLRAKNILAWGTFVQDYFKYLSTTKERPVFLLIAEDETPSRTPYKELRVLHYADAVDSFDTYAFATMTASETLKDRHEKQYMALLLATFCGNDVELCAACGEYGRAFLQNPEGILTQIMQEKRHADGRPFMAHVNPHDLRRGIWRTQVQIAFPILEDFRAEYTRKYQAQLQITNRQPKDIELKDFLIWAQNGTIKISNFDFQKLNRLRLDRNTLAHFGILDAEEIINLLHEGEAIAWHFNA